MKNLFLTPMKDKEGLALLMRAFKRPGITVEKKGAPIELQMSNLPSAVHLKEWMLEKGITFNANNKAEKSV